MDSEWLIQRCVVGLLVSSTLSYSFSALSLSHSQSEPDLGQTDDRQTPPTTIRVSVSKRASQKFDRLECLNENMTPVSQD